MPLPVPVPARLLQSFLYPSDDRPPAGYDNRRSPARSLDSRGRTIARNRGTALEDPRIGAGSLVRGSVGDEGLIFPAPVPVHFLTGDRLAVARDSGDSVVLSGAELA